MREAGWMKTRYLRAALLAALLPLAGTTLAADVISTLDSYAQRQAELGQQLWQQPELGYLEHASSALLQKELQQAGFHIQANVAGMPTAFVASFRNGSKGPVIGLLAEMDALPGMAQAATPVD